MNLVTDISTQQIFVINSLITKITLMILRLVFVSSLVACAPPKAPPYSDSNEYLAQYGIIRGKTNEIEISGVKFRIPPNYPFTVDFASTVIKPDRKGNSIKIERSVKKGQVDKILFGLDFGKAIQGTGEVIPSSYVRQNKITTVRIEIASDTFENDYLRGKWIDLNKPVDQWGLIDYGVFKLSTEVKTPKGYPVYIRSHGPNIAETNFDIPVGNRNIHVTYYYNGSNTPHWKLIHKSVLDAVNSFLIFDSGE